MHRQSAFAKPYLVEGRIRRRSQRAPMWHHAVRGAVCTWVESLQHPCHRQGKGSASDQSLGVKFGTLLQATLSFTIERSVFTHAHPCILINLTASSRTLDDRNGSSMSVLPAVSFPSYKTVLLTLSFLLTLQTFLSVTMRFSVPVTSIFASLPLASLAVADDDYYGYGGGSNNPGVCESTTNISLSWYPPAKTQINDLSRVINGTGIYGFIFNSSVAPLNTYNWCNMPHVNKATYKQVDDSYKLEYVEVIHRHHKRTPYASNTFPVEGYSWSCSDESLFYGGEPLNPYGNRSTDSYWQVYTSPSNPIPPTGFNGTCQFPQITRGGLDDSHQHGKDLKEVYSDLLEFIPDDYNKDIVSYRVTNNVITSQVASMLIAGMYPEREEEDTSILIQPASIDSLEPVYSCPSGSNLFSSYGSGSSAPGWQAHLQAAASLYAKLDSISGISPTNTDWHKSFDHYFDNLSARLCHQKPLPCKNGDPTNCVTQALADEVFRLGEYEYSYIYRDNQNSLKASTATYGIWIAELSQNIRHAMGQGDSSVPATSQKVRYRHNVAHDGSVSRVLSILQLEQMVWPGMGSEVVFELYSKRKCFFVRVLWGGQVLKSSHPQLGSIDMIPVSRLLAYFDGLVGVGASKVPGLCSS